MPTSRLTCASCFDPPSGKMPRPRPAPLMMLNPSLSTASDTSSTVSEASPAAGMLISTDTMRIACGSVVLNDTRLLRKFTVTNNLPDDRVHVRLSSSLGRHIIFQLENENLMNGVSPLDAGEPANDVDLVTSIMLAPGEQREVILGFTSMSAGAEGISKSLVSSAASADSDMFYDVKGRIYLTASLSSASPLPAFHRCV